MLILQEESIEQLDSLAESHEQPPIIERPSPEYDLCKTLKTRGCPVCGYLKKVAFDFYAQWQHALASDETAQRAYAEELGFCPLHAWQMASIASPQGLSMGYPKLTEALSARLSAASDSVSPASEIVRNLIPSFGTCRVCKLLADREQSRCKQFAETLSDSSFRTAYAGSQGLCLRHLAAVSEFTDGATVHWLLDATARRFERLSEDLQNYAMKRDALRRTLLNDDEDDAYMRALIQISGERELCAPWPMDAEI